MIPYPNITPYFLKIGNVEFRWYGLMYLISFVLAFFMLRYLTRKKPKFSAEEISDLLLYCFVGMLLGARIFHFVFFDWGTFVSNAWNFFKIWQGGMSYHGGLAGIVVAILIYAKVKKQNPWVLGDLVVIPGSIVLALGRLGNFINGELYGRVTDLNWCMVFPQGGDVCRHPSQLYEMFFEGIVLFAIMWLCRDLFKKTPGVLTGIYFVAYGVMRFLLEFVREPEMVMGVLTMAQILSLIMIGVGLFFIFLRRRIRV